MTDLVSVIVATYNRPDALDAVLRSLACQTDRDFEIVIADDGSGTETAGVIKEWSARVSVPLRHVWHEDRGFRLAEIRNRAIRVSNGRYCIFLDGDCIVRKSFVTAHRQLARSGCFVTGNRVLLSAEFTRQILVEHRDIHQWGLAHWIGARLIGDVNRVAPLVRLPLGSLRQLKATHWRGARGSNMAFWREDLERVDGFDAAYCGWGREDSDIFVRMIRSGVQRRDGRFATGVLHLWHPEADRSGLEENERQLAQSLREGRVRAMRGLSTLIEDTKRASLDRAGMYMSARATVPRAISGWYSAQFGSFAGGFAVAAQ
jgi:glycosyltransferase involved in cell wall biosynthesis